MCPESRNRPEIRLNPAPAGFPASKSGSGSGSGWKKICRIFAGFQFFLPKKKSKKILANNKHGGLNRGKKWFAEKLRKNFDLENFRSKSFSRSTSCIRSSRFQARVAKGRPASRDHITGGNL